MRRYELSLSPGYVPTWGVVEAVRELFQNALDQEIIDEKNEMGYSYYAAGKQLVISSASSLLDKSSLLLGNSTKSDDHTTIGKFGEGYKIAMLVLCRLGYNIQIFNYKQKEVWTPKIINSRRYGSKILVVDVEKYIFKSVPDSNLTFSVIGITESDFDKIKEKTLFLQDHYDKIDTNFGEVLTDSRHKGSIFVNGLFVSKCNDANIKFGYNLKPKHLPLDRDRSLVDTFNFTWKTSELWSTYDDHKLVAKLINEKVSDVKYLNCYSLKLELSEIVFNEFQVEHGPTAVPVNTQMEYVNTRKRYPSLKPVITDDNTYKVIQGSQSYKYMRTTSSRPEKTPTEILQDFKNKYILMNAEAERKFDAIIRESENWVKI